MIIPNRTLVVYVVEFQKRGPPHAHFAVFTAQHTGGPVMLKRYGTVIRPVPARAGWNLGTKGKCKGSRKRCPRCPMRVCNCSRLHMFARRDSQYTDSLLRISNRLLRMCGLTQAKVCFWLRVISEYHCMSILCGRSRRSVSPLKIRTTSHIILGTIQELGRPGGCGVCGCGVRRLTFVRRHSECCRSD